MRHMMGTEERPASLHATDAESEDVRDFRAVLRVEDALDARLHEHPGSRPEAVVEFEQDLEVLPRDVGGVGSHASRRCRCRRPGDYREGVWPLPSDSPWSPSPPAAIVES